MPSPSTYNSLKEAIVSFERWLLSFPIVGNEFGVNAEAGLISSTDEVFNKRDSTADGNAQSNAALITVLDLQITPSDIEIRETLLELADKLKGNYPFHSPAYAGQMLKPPHELAWAAQALTMLINPNNHALDGGPPTSEMEKEIIPKFGSMFGFEMPVLGHLTSSGTIANLEALWVARNEHPDKGIAFSENAHYTHERMCGVLGLKSYRIPVLEDGNWDLSYLAKYADKIGTLVVTMGTTGAGKVESLHKILPVARAHGHRIHLDAAYGGYFKLLECAGVVDSEPWSVTGEADSIVIDPHKHGLQPYGCGCVLFRDPGVGRYYKHDSPYTYFSSEDLHLGEISLECSRAGAAAAGLWATLRVFGLDEGGRMQRVMGACRRAAVDFARELTDGGRFAIVEEPELDIVLYFPVPDGELGSLSGVSGVCEEVFREGMARGAGGVFVSLIKLPARSVLAKYPHLKQDTDIVTVLRSVLMKPDHLEFVPELVQRLNSVLEKVLSERRG